MASNRWAHKYDEQYCEIKLATAEEAVAELADALRDDIRADTRMAAVYRRELLRKVDRAEAFAMGEIERERAQARSAPALAGLVAYQKAVRESFAAEAKGARRLEMLDALSDEISRVGYYLTLELEGLDEAVERYG
jgi:hypothetical protein